MIILYLSIFLLLEIPIFSRNRGNKHNTKKQDTINRAATGNYTVLVSQSGKTNINSVDGQEGDINIGNSLSGASDVNIKTGTTGEVNIKSNTINIIGNTDTSIFNIKNNNATPVTVFSVASETGNTTVGGTLDVTGATTLSSTLDVTGATTLSSTLDVTGATTLAGLTAGASGLGNTTVGGTLDVTGATTLSSTLDVTGATTLAGLTAGASALGNTTVGGTLGVTGTISQNSQPVATQSWVISQGYVTGSTDLTTARNFGTAATGGVTLGNVGQTTIINGSSITTTGRTRIYQAVTDTSSNEVAYIELLNSSNLGYVDFYANKGFSFWMENSGTSMYLLDNYITLNGGGGSASCIIRNSGGSVPLNTGFSSTTSTIANDNRENIFDFVKNAQLVLPNTTAVSQLNNITEFKRNIRYVINKNVEGVCTFGSLPGGSAQMTLYGTGSFTLNGQVKSYVDETQFTITSASQITFTELSTQLVLDKNAELNWTSPASYDISIPGDHVQSCIVLAAKNHAITNTFENSIIIAGEKIVLSGNTKINGTITASGLGTAGSGTALVLETGTDKIIPMSSSRRYKDNIQTIEDISEGNLDALDVVEFNYKQQEHKKCVGLIAEDLVGTPFEFAVFYNAEGLPESIDYQSIFVYLLGCYKKTTHEFKEILKNHTDEIQVLKEQNEIFKQMLNI